MQNFPGKNVHMLKNQPNNFIDIKQLTEIERVTLKILF